MAADAAARAIRSVDGEGSIGMVSAEPDPPYERPPLTKGLWKETAPQSIWRGTPELGVDLLLDRRVIRVDPDDRTVTDDPPRGLIRISSVWNPPPSAMCGKITGDGAGRIRSATGNVVNSSSFRALISDRTVSATNGFADATSSTPVNPTGSPLMNPPASRARCPDPFSVTLPGPLPASVAPSFR